MTERPRVSKEAKSAYNKTAYLKRKAKKEKPQSEEEEDNVADIAEEVSTEPEQAIADIAEEVITQPKQAIADIAEQSKTEYDEMEISQEDFERFKQWQTINKDVEGVKKKIDGDPSYLWTVLKTLGVALAPAMLGVIQRSALKAVLEPEKEKETPPEIHSENSIHASGVTGSSRWSPLDAPRL